MVDGSANVRERFLYDLDGNTTFLKADFSPQSTQESPSQWEFLFGGLYRDPETGLYFDGAGYYHPRLGRAVSTGSIGNFSEAGSVPDDRRMPDHP